MIVAVLLLSLIPISNLYSVEQDPGEDNKVVMNAAIYNDLRSRQQSDGSWDNDFETTMIASNALVQNNVLLDEHSETIEQTNDDGADVESQQVANGNSLEIALFYTYNNYEDDTPLPVQIMINYDSNFIVNTSSQDIIESNISARSFRIIENSQSQNGSWKDDIKLTGLSLFTLKKNSEVKLEVIEKGEEWLIEHQDQSGSWGSILNDSLAILALHDTDYGLSNAVDNLINDQNPNGSFGDIETTAWATIALTLYNSEESIEASSKAREWLLTRDNYTDREVALTSLADVEYLTAEISRLEEENIFYKEKGPPTEFYALLAIIMGSIIVLIAVSLRLRKEDILDGTRKDVYDLIKSNPGVNQNRIKRELGLSSSSVRHHLEVLKKFENPDTNQKGLAEALKLNPSTIHWHTKLLLKEKIITAKKIGKSVIYRISDPENTAELLGYAN
jgi:DNA-binding transcriptional ArsR family regulator